jgi:hypothetical protein
MNCQAYRDLLQGDLDRARPGPAAHADGKIDAEGLEQHLRDCPACTVLHLTARRLADALRRGAPPRPPLDLAQRITRQVLAQRVVTEQRARASSRSRSRRLVAALALAACVLLVLGGLRFFRSVEAPAPPDDLPRDSARGPGPTEDSGPVPAPSLRESMAEAGSAVARLTTRAADDALDHTRTFLPRVAAPSLDALVRQPEFEPPAHGFREAGEGVSAGLEPVTSSARRAFGLFRRELSAADPGL